MKVEILSSCLRMGMIALVTLIALDARGGLIAYEGFDYANAPSSNALVGQNGGTGWGANAWGSAGTGAAFSESQDDTSLITATFPFSPIGDRALAVGAGSVNANNRVNRVLPSAFNLAAEGGVLYASFLIRKDSTYPTGSSNNMEFSLTSGTGGNGTFRLGSTSANNFFLYNDATVPATAEIGAIAQSTNYFVVLKIESHSSANDVASAIIYDSSETVPLTEPVTWDKTRAISSALAIDRVQLWVGQNAAGAFDEIRIGDTWESVTSVPEPTSVTLITIVALIAVGKSRNWRIA